MKFAIIVVAILVVVLGAVHAYSLEGLQGWVLRLVAEKEDTVYASGFSDSAFRGIRRGMTESEVIDRVSKPLGEVWFYGGGQAAIGFKGDRVDHVSQEHSGVKLRVGATKDEVRALLGEPAEKSFVYSRSKADNSYHVRAVIFRGGRVNERVAEFYVD